ncbi:MAG: L-ribulose-5-phosphate 4-epimerase [Thermotogae bacterium]|nr:L-ribulose-5-phosphate 4-epimerase [Thermotogota bacterium]
MLNKLKEEVYKANIAIDEYGLVKLTWGNASAISREEGLVVIKPSGVDYSVLSPDDMVVVDLEERVVEGRLKPSSDTPTHIFLYRSFREIGGIVHTHSTWATAWAQACKSIPCFGTTHADHFYKEVPCTRFLKAEEVENDYELNTGKIIGETFSTRDYQRTPGVLVAGHAPFTWGKDVKDAVKNSIILEEIAKMACLTLLIEGETEALPEYIMNKHYFRKHGKDAYYGQK